MREPHGFLDNRSVVVHGAGDTNSLMVRLRASSTLSDVGSSESVAPLVPSHREFAARRSPVGYHAKLPACS
jgi:hypothetical protein